MKQKRWTALFLFLILVVGWLPITVQAAEISYLYNGIVLPPLPDEYLNTYPYAIIVSSTDHYTLFLLPEQPYVSGDYLYISSGLSYGYYTYGYNSSGVSWAYMNTYKSSSVGFTYSSYIIWSSVDIFYSSGGLFYSGSVPVPCDLSPVITVDVTAPYLGGMVDYSLGASPDPLYIEVSGSAGGVLSYQWYVGDFLTDYENGLANPIPGAVEQSYTPSTATTGIKYYNCVVTNTLDGFMASVSSSVLQFVVSSEADPETEPPETTVATEPAYSEPLGDIQDSLDSVGAGITDVADSVKSLPEKIMEGIKGLFIPDAEAMAEQQEKWMQLLEDRFGAVYESISLVDELLQTFKAQTANGTITIPSVTVPLAGTDFTFGGWNVQVIPDGFAPLVEVSKKIVDIVCTLAFLSSMKRRFERTVEG